MKEAAVFGLDMQSQVLIELEKTPANHYPNLDCEMPPHIAFWLDYETWYDFLAHLNRVWGFIPTINYNEHVPDSATGDEDIYFFYLRDED